MLFKKCEFKFNVYHFNWQYYNNYNISKVDFSLI